MLSSSKSKTGRPSSLVEHSKKWADRHWGRFSRMSQESPMRQWENVGSTKQFRVTNKSCIKLPEPPVYKSRNKGSEGMVSRWEGSKGSAVILALISGGHHEDARKLAEGAAAKGLLLAEDVQQIMKKEESDRHVPSWRSPWTPFVVKRSKQRKEKAMLDEDLRRFKEKAALEIAAHLEEEGRLETVSKLVQSVQDLRLGMTMVPMWDIMVHIAWKKKTFIVNVDNEYTVEMVKNEVRNLVGIAPEVQRLSLLPRIAIKAEGSALFRHMPHAPKYKSLGVLVVNNKKRKLKLSDKRWTDANVLIGKVPLSEDPLFFGDERMELVNNDEFIVKCGVQPQDMIEMDIDEEASRRLRGRILADLFGGTASGWKFDTSVTAAFQKVDLDGSNNIDANELRMAFENMQVYLTTEQMEDLVQNFDTDGDRRFDFDEFKAMVKLLIESRNE